MALEFPKQPVHALSTEFAELIFCSQLWHLWSRKMAFILLASLGITMKVLEHINVRVLPKPSHFDKSISALGHIFLIPFGVYIYVCCVFMLYVFVSVGVCVHMLIEVSCQCLIASFKSFSAFMLVLKGVTAVMA